MYSLSVAEGVLGEVMMMLQIDDRVQVVRGRYVGRGGKVICVPVSWERSDLITVLGADERAFLCHAHECEIDDSDKEISDGTVNGQN